MESGNKSLQVKEGPSNADVIHLRVTRDSHR